MGACFRMHAADAAFCDHDFTFNLRLSDFFFAAFSHPNQLGFDIGICTPGSQHRYHICKRGELLPPGGNFPKFSFDTIPGLSAWEPHDFSARQAVFFQLIVKILGFQKISGKFLGKSGPHIASTFHDGVPGGFAGGFSYDLVHLLLGQQGPA